MRDALDAKLPNSRSLQLLDELLGDRRDVTVRPSGRNHHLVGESAFSIEVDGGDVLGLGIVEAGEDKLEKVGMGGAGRTGVGREARRMRIARLCRSLQGDVPL